MNNKQGPLDITSYASPNKPKRRNKGLKANTSPYKPKPESQKKSWKDLHTASTIYIPNDILAEMRQIREQTNRSFTEQMAEAIPLYTRWLKGELDA